MKLARVLIAICVAAGVPGAASACLPSLPSDPPPPTLEERVRGAHERSTDIVYGVVTRRSRDGRAIPFKVLHVYKGSLKPGARLALEIGYGLDPPPCIHMMPAPPVEKGASGVIVFHNGFPRLTFLREEELALMFERGWIRRAGR